MNGRIHVLTGVRLVGFDKLFAADVWPRFSVIVAPEQADEVNNLGPSRLLKPSLRDGLIWLSARAPNAPIYCEIPNPWDKPFPAPTFGDVSLTVCEVMTPRRGLLRVVYFIGIRIARYPTWDEALAFAEARR